MGVKGSALSQHLLGILYAHEGRYEEATGAFLRAVEEEPEMAGSFVELGLIYARHGDYPKMTEALTRAVEIGAGGVRAYLGERPLGDAPHAPAPDVGLRATIDPEGGAVLAVITSVMAHLALGHDEEAVVILEHELDNKPGLSPAVVALLALTYLLRGEGVEADDAGIRRAAAGPGGRVRRC
jgi:tetratricopeptide (TPR) repeat protein